MKNETISVGVTPKLYLDLGYHLLKTGDGRSAEEVVAVAIKQWLAQNRSNPAGRGYQWGLVARIGVA